MGFEKKDLIFGKGRLEALTDGVFAIIMTILVFNISRAGTHFICRGRLSHQRDFLLNLLIYGLIS